MSAPKEEKKTRPLPDIRDSYQEAKKGPVECPDCKGTGRGKINTSAPENEDCERCSGMGEVKL